jgi:hypothetical protein
VSRAALEGRPLLSVGSTSGLMAPLAAAAQPPRTELTKVQASTCSRREYQYRYLETQVNLSQSRAPIVTIMTRRWYWFM